MYYEDVNYDEFEYLVVRPKPAKICFGSGAPRKLMSDKRGVPIGPNPAKYKIAVLQKKVHSKRGIPGLANLGKRFQLENTDVTPDPTKYSTFATYTFRQCPAPFNSSSMREPVCGGIREGPGPGVYNIANIWTCKRTRVDHNFGKACVVPAVEMLCVPYSHKKCEKCGERFEFGDFWHRNYSVYLCTICMDEEHRLHEMYTENELHVFKKIRTCAFMHRHEGTTAAVKLMKPRDIQKKLRIENYLSLYIQCFHSRSRS